jgi:hypothetical protein
MERNAPRASLRRVIAGSLAAGLGAGLVVSPLAGLVVAVIVAASLALPRAVGRGVLTGSALAALAAAAGLVLARSVWHGGVPPGFEWPASFPLAQPLALTGLVLVAVDAVLERAPSRPPPGEP